MQSVSKGRPMSGPSKCMLILTAEIDADFEKEWNAGYEAVHFPDMLCTAWRPWRSDIRDRRGQSSPTTGMCASPRRNPTPRFTRSTDLRPWNPKRSKRCAAGITSPPGPGRRPGSFLHFRTSLIQIHPVTENAKRGGTEQWVTLKG